MRVYFSYLCGGFRRIGAAPGALNVEEIGLDVAVFALLKEIIRGRANKAKLRHSVTENYRRVMGRIVENKKKKNFPLRKRSVEGEGFFRKIADGYDVTEHRKCHYFH